MKKLTTVLNRLILALIASFFSCHILIAPSILAAAPISANKSSTDKTHGTGKMEWDKTLEAAKKEGMLSVYTIWPPKARMNISKAFTEKFNIRIEYTPFSRGAEMMAKVQAEKRAGLYLADAFGGGSGTLISVMKPGGVLGAIEPMLILSEVLDPKSWKRGKFPFLDKEKEAIGLIEGAQPMILFNTNFVKKRELTGFKDLLKPQYRGKITLNDPTVSGQGNSLVSNLAFFIWNFEEAKEYLTQLIKQQKIVIQRDNRLHVESVARGKFSIGLAGSTDIVEEFIKAGAPIEIAPTKEGVGASSGFGGIGVPTKFNHPNAAKIFINWLLTKEGQDVLVKSFGYPGRRIDATTEGISPLLLPQPGQEVYDETEEFIVFKGKMLKISKGIIEEASK